MTSQVPTAFLRFRPRTGWQQAGPVHRALALAAVPLVLAVALAMATDLLGLYVVTLALTVVSFGAVARVVRPYPPGTLQVERRLRHATAAVATTFGGSFLLLMGVYAVGGLSTDGSDDGQVVELSFGLWQLAALLFLVTVVWGVAAMLVRIIREERSRFDVGPGRHAAPAQPSAAARSASTI